MPKGYHHLTYEQRCQIFALKDSHSKRSIAKKLDVNASTISRELNRNSGPAGYFLNHLKKFLWQGGSRRVVELRR